MLREKFYQIHTETTTAVATSKYDRLEGTYSYPVNNIDHIGCLWYICIFVCSVGISNAELRYDVPSLVNNKPDRLEGTYSNPINNIDHIQSFIIMLFTLYLLFL